MGRQLVAAPVTLAALLVSLTAYLVPDISAGLQFDRAAMAAGQGWRAFTGHLAHWSAEHLFWDAAMFLALGWWLEARNRPRLIACLVFAAAAISAALWWAQPELQLYRGLSGLDTALFALLAIDLLRDNWRQGRVSTSARAATGTKKPELKNAPNVLRSGWFARSAGWLPTLLLAGLLAKTVFEWLTGATLFVNAEGFTPVPLAHLVGALVGLGIGLVPAQREP